MHSFITKNKQNTSGGQKSQQVSTLTNTDFRTSARCSTLQAIKDMHKNIDNIDKELQELRKKKPNSFTDMKELTKHQNEISSKEAKLLQAENTYKKFTANDKTKENANAEMTAGANRQLAKKKGTGGSTISHVLEGEEGESLVEAYITLDDSGSKVETRGMHVVIPELKNKKRTKEQDNYAVKLETKKNELKEASLNKKASENSQTHSDVMGQLNTGN